MEQQENSSDQCFRFSSIRVMLYRRHLVLCQAFRTHHQPAPVLNSCFRQPV